MALSSAPFRRRCAQCIPPPPNRSVVSIADSFAAAEIAARLRISRAQAIFTQVRRARAQFDPRSAHVTLPLCFYAPHARTR